jgi:hypothetical protein
LQVWHGFILMAREIISSRCMVKNSFYHYIILSLPYGVPLRPLRHIHNSKQQKHGNTTVKSRNNETRMVKNRRFDDDKSKVRWCKAEITKPRTLNFQFKDATRMQYVLWKLNIISGFQHRSSFFRLLNIVVSTSLLWLFTCLWFSLFQVMCVSRWPKRDHRTTFMWSIDVAEQRWPI